MTIRMMSGLDRLVRGLACVGMALVAAMTVASSAQAQTAVMPPGSGTAANPYQISQLGHLVWMGDNVGSSSGKYYTMQNDLDASATAGWNSGAGFAPIGNNVTRFRGIFNGSGKVISSLLINRPSQDYVGLFGDVGSSAVVKDLGLTGGSVTGNASVGGLVGENYYGTVSECYAAGVVAGYYAVGDLVGYNYGTVSECYATGLVTGNSTVGGLVGYTSGMVSNSYWDTQTSEQATSAGGTGKTTAQMKQQATFAGWNFTSVWRITENVTYPYFVTMNTGLWGGATDVGNGWKYLAWFGYFKDNGNGWIYHAEHGWLWSSSSAYPFFWHNTGGAWLYYYRGTGNGAGGWFYDYGTGHTEWR